MQDSGYFILQTDTIFPVIRDGSGLGQIENKAEPSPVLFLRYVDSEETLQIELSLRKEIENHTKFSVNLHYVLQDCSETQYFENRIGSVRLDNGTDFYFDIIEDKRPYVDAILVKASVTLEDFTNLLKQIVSNYSI